MAKAYWMTMYHRVLDPVRLAEYAALATPAIEAGGGRFLARGVATRTLEGTEGQRAVIIEFDSLERALAVYNGAPYQAALKALKGAVERDVRILEGVRPG